MKEKHIITFAGMAALMLLIMTGCGQQVPPVANGPQGWWKGEPYISLRNATIRASSTGSWVSRRYEKMDWREINKLSRAEQEALIAAGYDPWTGSFKQTAGGVTPYKVEYLSIAGSLTQGKTYDAKGKEVPLQCLVSTGAGLFREAKKAPAPTTTFGAFFPRAPEYVEQAPSPVIIAACAKQDAQGWNLSHITVEKPKKQGEEGGK